LRRGSMPHKNDVSGDHDMVSGKIKAAILFVVRAIANKDTPGGTRSKIMRGYHGQVGVAGTPKDLEMLIGRRCVVEGGVWAGGSDGFVGRRFNKYVAVWRLSTQYCGGMEA
jgi:hypothetical protein